MRELMSPPGFVEDPEQTKSRILMESVRLFAVPGYHAVSVREIAAAIGLQPGSIYNYFVSKQEIMESIMKQAEYEFHLFYEMLDQLSESAASFSQLLNNIFAECKEVVNPSMFYATYCAMLNQFEIDCCRHVYYDVYFKEGHQVMRRQLETAIARGLVKPFDVPAVAGVMTNCFLSMVSFNVAKLQGIHEDFDLPEWYDRQIEHILKVTGALALAE